MYLQLVSIGIGVGAAYGCTAWVIQVAPLAAPNSHPSITPTQLRLVMALPIVTLIVTITSFVAPTVVIAGILTYLVTLITIRIRSRSTKEPDPHQPH